MDEVYEGLEVRDGRIVSPGQYEGEAVWVPAAHQLSLDGSWDSEGSVVEDGWHLEWTVIDEDFLEEIAEMVGGGSWELVDEITRYLVLHEDGQGFVRGYIQDKPPGENVNEEGT